MQHPLSGLGLKIDHERPPGDLFIWTKLEARKTHLSENLNGLGAFVGAAPGPFPFQTDVRIQELIQGKSNAIVSNKEI